MKYFYWFIQNLMWPFGWMIVRFFYTLEVRGRENLRGLKAPFIIAPNHRHAADGFFVALAFPWLSRLFPVRFMIEDVQFAGKRMEALRKIGLIKIFSVLVGGFPSKRGTGIENAIKLPLEFLSRKSNILMFPEGRVQHNDNFGQFYHGTSTLALRSGVPILPILIKIKNKVVSLTIGAPFKLKDYTVESGTLTIREKIEELKSGPSWTPRAK